MHACLLLQAKLADQSSVVDIADNVDGDTSSTALTNHAAVRNHLRAILQFLNATEADLRADESLNITNSFWIGRLRNISLHLLWQLQSIADASNPNAKT